MPVAGVARALNGQYMGGNIAGDQFVDGCIGGLLLRGRRHDTVRKSGCRGAGFEQRGAELVRQHHDTLAELNERVGNRQRAGRAIRLTDHGGTDAESGGDKDAFSAQQFARCGQKPAAFGMGGQSSSSRIPAGHRFNGADGFVQGGCAPPTESNKSITARTGVVRAGRRQACRLRPCGPGTARSGRG